MVISLLTIGFISLVWGVVIGMMARQKNRSFPYWFVAGCCLWFLPLIALLLLKRIKPPNMGDADDADFRATQIPTTIFPDTRIP
jgi:hypothetical protein